MCWFKNSAPWFKFWDHPIRYGTLAATLYRFKRV